MATYTRGEFLGLGAALAGAVLTPRPAAAQAAASRLAGTEPDLIVVNARMLTSDAVQPRAEAFAVKDGRFLAVGSTADVRNLATARTAVIDAAGMFVSPGFIDAHCHPSGVNELDGVNCNLRTVAPIQAALRAKAAATPPGYWVSGFMFDDTKLDRPLTRRDLDAATTAHPVSVAHRGGHTTFYNSKAFELAGITVYTPDPPDGRFDKGKDDGLTGRVAENARAVFGKVGNREHGEKWTEYGDEKMKWMMAHRSFVDAGIPVPGASDYTPGPFEPLMAIQSLVTRKDYKGRVSGPNQRVTVDEAFAIATINGAYASSEEHLKGSIAAGKLADFVILERAPHDVEPDAIMAITVVRTVVGGQTAFTA